MISKIHHHQNTIETGMNLYVHTRTMKIVLYTKDPRLRASPRHGGQGVFLNFYHRSAPGAPRRGRRLSSYMMDRVVTIPALYLNNTIFIGKVII
jgi:hypothetical protein